MWTNEGDKQRRVGGDDEEEGVGVSGKDREK